MARCLKQQLGAELHFLTKQPFVSILEHNPNLDRIFSFDKKLRTVLPALRREKYDWVLDLHGNLRSARVKLALQRPSRTFNKLNVEKWLLVNLGIDLLPERHIVHRYMDITAHLNVQYDGLGLDYFIPESEDVNLTELAPELQPNNYIVFNIGANHATKRLPEEQIISICKALDMPVLLLGGKEEAATGAKIVAASGRQVLNCCGTLSLHQSASVVKQAAKVITHDSGLMHIAAAFQKEIVSVWGNTVPRFGMYPLFPEGQNRNTSIEVPALKCRPCSKIGYAECPKGHFNCMRKQDIPAILQALK